MASRHCVVAAGAALLAVSLAACDGTTDGNDPPTTPATVSFPDDPNKAPSVPDPIQADAFIKKPCTSLTPEQQKKYNLDSGATDAPGYTDPPRFSDTCFYPYTNSDRWIRISYSRDGLQGLYDSGPTQPRWEPQVLDGHPAVATDVVNRVGVPSYPPSCLYYVGLNDLLYFSVLAQDTDGDSECGLAKKIAADVLSTIKESR